MFTNTFPPPAAMLLALKVNGPELFRILNEVVNAWLGKVEAPLILTLIPVPSVPHDPTLVTPAMTNCVLNTVAPTGIVTLPVTKAEDKSFIDNCDEFKV